MTNPPPPGWYHAQGDPPGTNRWWDGATWVGGPVLGSGAPPGYGGAPGVPVVGSAGPYGYSSAYGYGVPQPFAGFWQRLGASVLDSLILGAPSGIITTIILGASPTEQRPCTINGRRTLCEGPTDGSLALVVLISVAFALAGIIFYYGQLEGKTGQTIGKKALGIKTVRRSTGQPPGVGRAIGRAFAHYLSALPCALGYFWMLWDRDKQTWHDKLADTVVIRAAGY